jgi:hypothetical protein
MIVSVVAILVLAVTGAWGYLWYSTKQQVDEMVTLAKPFADISYGGIDISPTGAISINRLQIILNAINDVVSIGAIRLQAPNILALLNIRHQLSNGQLPEALSISLQNLALSLEGGLLGANQTVLAQQGSLENLDALGCGAILAFGSTEWQEMGYKNLTSDLTLSYRIDRAHNLLSLQMASRSQEWASIEGELEFATTVPLSSIMELVTGLTAKVAKLNLAVHDSGFNQRRNTYCAAKAGKAVDAYIADHARLVAEKLRAHGINLGPGLLDAYRDYLSPGGRLTLAASPPSPIDPSEFRFYKADDIVKLAGLKATINDKPVNDLSLSWDSAKLAQTLAIKTQAPVEPEKITVAPSIGPTPEMTVSVKKTFHPIATSELSKHVGKIIKIKTTTNSQYNGKLEGVNEGYINITIRKPNGSATLSLRLNELTQAEVLY